MRALGAHSKRSPPSIRRPKRAARPANVSAGAENFVKRAHAADREPPRTSRAAPRPFASRLIAWQKERGRHDLPWQHTRDAYRVWLSEIMLQQTQVSTVIPYYQRFLAAFPDVASLAAAPIGRVLELWSGLGYYRRAHLLHRAAQSVVAEHGGAFPRNLSALPGIGRST